MTREEEIQRYIEERSMLENQIEADNEIMAQIERDIPYDFESVPEWNYAWDEVTAAENEIQSINTAIKELEDRDV